MKYFTLKELTKTKHKIKNIPNQEQLENIHYLVKEVLDPARAILGRPITVSSGFRNPEVNRAVGGGSTSQHLRGEAADIVCYDNSTLFDILKELDNYDQLIWEYGTDESPAWVHVSTTKKINRKEILRAKKVNGGPVYTRLKR